MVAEPGLPLYEPERNTTASDAMVVVDVAAAVVLDVDVVEVDVEVVDVVDVVVLVGKATCIGSNPIILAAVEEADTAPINPGINPDADTNVNTLPFIVFTTNVPGVPTYRPPYPLFCQANSLPLNGVTGSPPENCGLDTYPSAFVKLAIAYICYFLFYIV